MRPKAFCRSCAVSLFRRARAALSARFMAAKLSFGSWRRRCFSFLVMLGSGVSNLLPSPDRPYNALELHLRNQPEIPAVKTDRRILGHQQDLTRPQQVSLQPADRHRTARKVGGQDRRQNQETEKGAAKHQESISSSASTGAGEATASSTSLCSSGAAAVLASQTTEPSRSPQAPGSPRLRNDGLTSWRLYVNRVFGKGEAATEKDATRPPVPPPSVGGGLGTSTRAAHRDRVKARHIPNSASPSCRQGRNPP
jgi:hypothetical protein